MKKLILLFLLLNTSILFAQEQPNWCGTDAIREQMRAKYPDYDQQVAQFERKISDYLDNNIQSNNRAIVTIPVVVHIVHHDQAVLNSISEAQVQSQIDVLNRDFAQANSDFSHLPPIFADRCSQVPEIRFCLARQNPNGLYTTGIEKRLTTIQGFDQNDDDDQVLSVKSAVLGLEAWNTEQYLNVWVCNIVGDNVVNGYAPVPPLPPGEEWRDGVVLDYRVLGALLHSENHISRNMGRALVHEVGHYLGLLHLWGVGDDPICGDDFCNDTPLQKGANSSQPTFPKYNNNIGINECEYPACPNVCDEGNMFMNHMDATNDKTRIAFTNDQKDRMTTTLNTHRAGLITTPGCMPGNTGIFLQKARGVIPANSAYVNDITTSQATLHWLHWASNSYQVRIKKASDSTFPNFGTAQTDNVKVLTSLNSGTTYNVEIKHNLPNGTSKIISTSFTTNSLSAPTSSVPDAGNYYTDAEPIILTGNVTTINNHTINAINDHDWFMFTAPGNQPNIKITLKNLPRDYDIKVYNDPTAVDALNFPYHPFNPFTIPEVFTYNNTILQLYYIWVKSYHGDFSTNAYQLIIETSSAPFGKTESPNEDANGQPDSRLFSAYPNPTYNGYFNLSLMSEVDDYATVELINLLGQVVYSQKNSLVKGQNDLVNNVGDISQGVYMLRCITKQKTETQIIQVY